MKLPYKTVTFLDVEELRLVLRAERIKQCITQKTLGEAVGLSANKISKIENRDYHWNAFTAQKAINFLGL